MTQYCVPPFVGIESRGDEDGKVFRFGFAPDRFQNAESIQDRHFHIEDYEIGVECLYFLQSDRTVFSRFNVLETVDHKMYFYELTNHLFIINDVYRTIREGEFDGRSARC